MPTTGPLPKMEADEITRLMHAVLGVQSEAGELADILKRHLFYGQPLDLVHIAEELGDICWYIAIGTDAAGFPLGNVFNAISDKLRVRYGDEFDMAKAAEKARDRPAERRAMMAALFDGLNKPEVPSVPAA
jgi:NTP pyrophosphatase (non-canonical NTP hydrolase)